MPIVAGIGGNNGNQTATVIVREIALQQVQMDKLFFILKKEIGIAIANGFIFGIITGIMTCLLYQNIQIAIVMILAIIFNLMVASLIGVITPIFIMKLGKDPAFGSSIIITAITDVTGFLIFLSLATIFLI